ncbi:hypothetical protein Gotur_034929 [Gossypium turneri]
MPRRRLRDLCIIQYPPNSEETNSEQQTSNRSSNVLNKTNELWREAQNSKMYTIKIFIQSKFCRACQSS